MLDRTGAFRSAFKKAGSVTGGRAGSASTAADLVGVTGELAFTQKGEPTIWVDEIQLLSKAVAPPPRSGTGSPTWRPGTAVATSTSGHPRTWRDVFIKRSKALSTIRQYLEAEGYLEVETPTLHPIMGGAAARPFVTHHNALDADFYLRIAPELYLKRLDRRRPRARLRGEP